MMWRKSVLCAIGAAAAIAAAMPTGARANIEAGSLNCRSPGGVGFVVGSVLNFDCVFVPSYPGRPQHYVAVIRHIGVDLGFTQNVALGWAVFAPTRFVQPGDLSGSYGGVQAGATVGVGVGANALVGGSNNSIALQPVSGQAQTGLNVSAGLADLELRPADFIGGRHYFRRHHRH